MNIQLSILAPTWNQYEDLQTICNYANEITFKELQPLYSEILKGEISLVFTDNEHIQELNAKWRQKNKATNVLSFPSKQLIIGEIPPLIWGDIIFAYETILLEAKEQNKSFKNHFCHLFIHGLLHLLGFDHKTEADATQMEALECNILNKLNIKNPYTTY